MDVLMSRVLLQPVEPARSRRFYRDLLGLPVYREFGDPADPGLVFFLGGGFLELSGRSERSADTAPRPARLWLQVRNIDAEYRRLLAAGVVISHPPRTEPWGLIELWLADPDGTPIVLVEVPADHPLRRDQR